MTATTAGPSEKAYRPIDKERVLNTLRPGGALSLLLKRYECREEQLRMLSDVIDAYQEHHIALIEAGTGIGKSMAYLLPAILWRQISGERTIVSTKTINLQEQLLNKDIPLAAKVLGTQIKAVLVKGMSNYVCLRKVQDASKEKGALDNKEREELEQIEKWCGSTRDGSLSDLSFSPSYSSWERVRAESDTCTHKRCPFFQECHFFNARNEAEDAHLLIVNHSMLFADLSVIPNEEEAEPSGILPIYRRVILDEAHHLEDAATEFFANRVSQSYLEKLLGKLGSEKQGRLPLLLKKLLYNNKEDGKKETAHIHTLLLIELPAMRRELLQRVAEAFDALFRFVMLAENEQMEDETANPQHRERKLRILPKHTSKLEWGNTISPAIQTLGAACRTYVQTVAQVEKEISAFDNKEIKEQTETLRQEIRAYTGRMSEAVAHLEEMFCKPLNPTKVLWLETKQFKGYFNVECFHAELDISNQLVKSLFSRFPTTVLCSATLTTNNNFSFIRERLGLVQEALPKKNLRESIFLSPFNYEKQALMLMPNDMPEPSSALFCQAACDRILQCLYSSRGGAFVLFTSYAMLSACHDILAPQLEIQRFTALKQGELNRKELLEKFKHSERGVLFGTDSFWEGVDVVGDALRLVILVKLPFKVPSEPIIQARTEAIRERGGNPFYEYSLPNALVKFKQGFGRLIRNNKDRGCIVCLDPRIITKRYGKSFLASLPNCPKLTVKGEELKERMDAFYRSTYALQK